MAPEGNSSCSPIIRYSRSTDSVTIEKNGFMSEFRCFSSTKMMEKLRSRKQPEKYIQNDFEKDNRKIKEAESLMIKRNFVKKVDHNHKSARMTLDTHITDGLAKSNLISVELFRKIGVHLPLKTFFKKTTLIYSSYEHGFSLQTLYRKCKSWAFVNEVFDDQTPSILAVSDTNGHIFGAVLSCLPRIRGKRFVGSGESALFKLHPDIQFYPWSGRNDFFLNCEKDSISVGGSHSNGDPNAGTGLWFDQDLLRGRSMRCQTFNSPTLSSEEDFTICGVELWTFSS